MGGTSGLRDGAQTPGPNEIATNEIVTFMESRYNGDYASLFNALGALAGFGCQMAVREGFVKTGLLPEKEALTVVEARDGKTYYFGDFLNEPVLSTEPGRMSVWSLVAGAAKSLGARELLSVEELVARTARNVGFDDFGVPQVSKNFKADQLPIEVLVDDWPDMQKFLTKKKVDPKFWGWIFPLAAQRIIIKLKSSFDPVLAVRIVMEAAVPMSHIDPKIVFQQK